MTNVKLQVAPTAELIDVFNPYDGKVVESVRASTSDDVNALLERANRGAAVSRALPRHRRAAILEVAARLVSERLEDFARTIVCEAGKTITQARKEAPQIRR